MSTRHTDEFQKQLADFNNDMNGSKYKPIQTKLFSKASSETVIEFVMNMSAEQLREVTARIRAKDKVEGFIGNREVYDYCKEYSIVPDKNKDPKKYYHLLEQFQDVKVDNRECCVMDNNIEKGILTVSFYDNDEIIEIEY